jgi:hypothetical protein
MGGNSLLVEARAAAEARNLVKTGAPAHGTHKQLPSSPVINGLQCNTKNLHVTVSFNRALNPPENVSRNERDASRTA